MKKNNILLIVMLLLLAVYSCEDDYEAPFEFSDVEWKISETPEGSMFVLSQDDYMSFVDLSQGALSHQWTISEGCYFLNSDFTKNDSVYSDFVIPNAGNISKDTRVHVMFGEGGLKEVNLYNTYEDSVSFITAEEDTIPAVQQGDIWVVDTTFVVDVYEHIQPAFKVYFGETLVKEVEASEYPVEEERASWDTLAVEVGQELTFVDLTTIGRPNTRTWMIENAVPAEENDSVATIAFYKMGVTTGSVDVKRTGDLPKGNTTKLIPLIVKVIQSSQPFEFAGTAAEIDDKKIGFNVSGEVADFFGEEVNFSVHVVNETSGFESDIVVIGAAVSSSDATMIELTLAEEIYNTDKVYISYAGGAIKSLDERDLLPFSDQLVEMEIGNSITSEAICGFEEFKDNFKTAYANGWWVGKVNDNFARTEDQAGNGVASMKYSSAGGITDIKMYAKAFLANGAVAPAGPYIERIKVYIPESTTMTAFRTYMVTPAHITLWDLTDVPKGKWVTLSQNVEFVSQPTEKYGIDIKASDNPDVTGDQEIYFDTMELIPLEARPVL